MSPLRKQMIDAMRQPSFSVRTNQSYLGAVVQLARFCRRSPDTLAVDAHSGEADLDMAPPSRAPVGLQPT